MNVGKISEDAWKILDCFRRNDWEASALKLNNLGMLNYRARVSDLRHRFQIEIVADSETDPNTGKLHTIYIIKSSSIPRATHLWRYKSLEGYAITDRQTTLV